MSAYRHPYPFSAIVGQEDLKLALLVNAVSPEVGGVLVRGEKGTAKSTAVRALARLLPRIRVVSGCPYSCDPEAPNPECPAGPHPADASSETRPVRLVELPVGASTDRLAGTLDIEKALSEGRKAFEPGLLAAAHRGILYVDEVNLLSDHLVDLLLDVAAMGVNHVEREGVSVRHPSRFILVGTMNPEEGELRPQLLDRFGVTVEVSGNPDPARQGRGRQAQAPLRGRPRGVLQRMVERGREARSIRGIGPSAASRRRPGRGHAVQDLDPLRRTRRRRPARRPGYGEDRPRAGGLGRQGRGATRRREAGRPARPLAPPQARPLRAARHRPRGTGERSSPRTPTRRTARTAAPHRSASARTVARFSARARMPNRRRRGRELGSGATRLRSRSSRCASRSPRRAGADRSVAGAAWSRARPGIPVGGSGGRREPRRTWRWRRR